jgi:hypothetical protein
MLDVDERVSTNQPWLPERLIKAAIVSNYKADGTF